MALFVELDDEGEPPNAHHPLNPHGMKPEWAGAWPTSQLPASSNRAAADGHGNGHNGDGEGGDSSGSSGSGSGVGNGMSNGIMGACEDDAPRPQENPRNGLAAEALGCYPIAMAVASSLDLNALDNLARTCRQVRQSLLAYRRPLVAHTLHCVNEDEAVDPDDTFRYRARAGNWFYAEDISRAGYSGKSGQCARDMVAECRRCAKVVCRNCAIKPPAPVVLRERHRRLCVPCTKAPIALLVKPPLSAGTPVDDELMKRKVCTCQSEGVWLCQPCGRSIRGADHDYQSIWRWRNQYGDGLGTGIGDGDCGVICGRDGECCKRREQEQETDCDAEDARELEAAGTPPSPPWASTPNSTSPTPSAALGSPPPGSSPRATSRAPSPLLGPGYARHEIEGIGGVVKTKRLRMIKVGACVPEWKDEKNRGEVLGREVKGTARSWCGWCQRVIPGQKDYENATTA